MTAQRAAGLSAAAWRGAAGLGAAALLRSSFAAKAGSTRFYLLTAGLAESGRRRARRGPIPVAPQRLAHPPRKRGAGPYRRPRRHRGRDLRRVLRCRAGRPPPPHPAPCHRQRAALRRRRVNPAGRAHRVEQRGGGRLFFRGALWSGSRPLRTTTLAYAVSTAATGNPALVLAGLITSVIFGSQRAATGGVLAPAVTHVTWSVLMLRYLPPLFRDADRPPVPAGHHGSLR